MSEQVSLRNFVLHKRSANSFVDAELPMNKIDPTRYFYPQVVLRMQEDVEICKCGGVKRCGSTARPS